MNPKPDTWKVAAVLLAEANLRYGIYLHYRELANSIKASGLTTLGEKGETHSQTMGAILRNPKHREIFESQGKGEYSVKKPEELSRLSWYREIKAALQQKEIESDEISKLRIKIKKLEERNELLERKLRQINEISR